MKLTTLFITVYTLFTILMLSSCSTNELDDMVTSPIMTLDARLPMDANGYYHLELNPNTNQTIHRISGSVLNTIEPTKVSWESNLSWELNGEVVPTINPSSYVDDVSGEINTMIAPIYGMRTDTLRIKSSINEWDIVQEIKIVLE